MKYVESDKVYIEKSYDNAISDFILGESWPCWSAASSSGTTCMTS